MSRSFLSILNQILLLLCFKHKMNLFTNGLNSCLSKIMFVFLTISTFWMSWAFMMSTIRSPIVITTLGYVKGNIMISRDHGSFYAFRGIPYAKPPIGELRFKKPLVADPWYAVFDASEDALPCPQYYLRDNSNGKTSENCLMVNVYSKKLPSTHTGNVLLLPVLVWIHGGGFAVGSAGSNKFSPEAIMDRNVVLVTVAYRLGPFGTQHFMCFLSTGDSAAYGNAGMLDQVMALKWVQGNIAGFGGDPQRVTIFGGSAGGASVIFHLLSPLSKGLFQAAIAQSGSALCHWVIQKNPLEFAIKLGRPFNCFEDNTSLLVACLGQQSLHNLVGSAYDLMDYEILYLPFVPVIETLNDGRFLQEDPMKILQEGIFNKVPVISGINKDEGVFVYNLLIEDFKTTYDVEFKDKLQEVIGILLQNKYNLQQVTTAIMEKYFNDIDFSNKSAAIRATVDMLSDLYFKAANDLTVRLLAANGVPVYMYEFAYAGSGSKSNLTGEIEINHADELYYLFDSKKTMTASDMYISNTLIDMWINFADQLNPTPVGSEIEWTPSPNGTIQYLRIGDNLTMRKNYFTNRMHFWNVVVPEIINNS